MYSLYSIGLSNFKRYREEIFLSRPLWRPYMFAVWFYQANNASAQIQWETLSNYQILNLSQITGTRGHLLYTDPFASPRNNLPSGKSSVSSTFRDRTTYVVRAVEKERSAYLNSLWAFTVEDLPPGLPCGVCIRRHLLLAMLC